MLRELVSRLQSGDLQVIADSGRLDNGSLRFELYNPHPQSKYITQLKALTIDGDPVGTAGGTLANPSVGGGHTDTRVDLPGPLSGFYIRREQTMVVSAPGMTVEPGVHHVSSGFMLADVLDIGASGALRVR